MFNESHASNPMPTTLAEARARKAHYVSVYKDLDWRDQPQGKTGPSQNELHVVFMKIADKANWKVPIDWTGHLTNDEVQLVQKAVNDNAGGGAVVRETGVPGEYRITAPGYYNKIGA